MAVDVTEATFQAEVLDRSRQLPVVVDFWADWCGPCKALSPALEKAEAARQGQVVLAKVDVDSNQQLAAVFKVQGIPAVKAFRDGAVVDEFVGAQPPARVEAFFDSLVPSKGDELLAAGDELSLREAAELEPRRADIAVALAKARLARGAEEEALEAVADHEGDFAAAGIAARIRLAKLGIGTDGFAALDRGERETALDALIEELQQIHGDDWSAGGLSAEDLRDLLRRAVVGILSEVDPADPTARTYRRRLSAALG
ncbi:MAG: tetratricopeptide repeat protein [Actinomycetota bacterium]|nr:tetratricopeptide repeat protein [Actinomycetota bacterium]